VTTISKLMGNHSLKTGFEGRLFRNNTRDPGNANGALQLHGGLYAAGSGSRSFTGVGKSDRLLPARLSGERKRSSHGHFRRASTSPMPGSSRMTGESRAS
jgi:hypothetical protein